MDAEGNSPTFPHLRGLKEGDVASSRIKQVSLRWLWTDDPLSPQGIATSYAGSLGLQVRSSH